MKSDKSGNSGKKDYQKDQTDDILAFINKYGIQNKDSFVKKPKETKPPRVLNSRRQPREILDLHGLKSAEAAQRLRFTVNRCIDKGIKELLVIHGVGYHSVLNGGPVLKEMVRQMIENELCLNIRDHKTAVPKDGGDGATLIYLR